MLLSNRIEKKAKKFVGKNAWYFKYSKIKLNLIFHFYPWKVNDCWKLHAWMLKRYLPFFYGKKVVAVATDDESWGIDEVKKEIDDPLVEYIRVTNNSNLCEQVSFLDLLSEVNNPDENFRTFYGHSKGNLRVTDDEDENDDHILGVITWMDNIYSHLLGHIWTVIDLLEVFKCVGTNKMIWPKNISSPYPSRLLHGNWMFAGTFFWFRNDAVFSHPDWAKIPEDRYAVEAYLSGLFPEKEAISICQSWPSRKSPWPPPYDLSTHTLPIFDFQTGKFKGDVF